MLAKPRRGDIIVNNDNIQPKSITIQSNNSFQMIYFGQMWP